MTDLRRDAGMPVYEFIIAGRFYESEAYATFRRRGTRDWLIVYTATGQGVFGHADGDLDTPPGKLALVAPGTLHDYHTKAGAGFWELHWAHFIPRPHWFELMNWPETAPGLMALEVPVDRRGALIALFVDVAALSRGTASDKQWALLRLEEILLETARFNPMSAGRIDERVAVAMNYMRGRLANPVTLTEVACACNISVSRLGALFRAQTGELPLQFLERQRIDVARQSLDFTSRSITDIAAEVGFSDPLYFSLRFKKHTGLSPRNYRHRDV